MEYARPLIETRLPLQHLVLFTKISAVLRCEIAQFTPDNRVVWHTPDDDVYPVSVRLLNDAEQVVVEFRFDESQDETVDKKLLTLLGYCTYHRVNVAFS